MFILDLNEVKLTIYAKGVKVNTSIELWHKTISHIVVYGTRGNKCETNLKR